jgi:hypothetical protein
LSKMNPPKIFGYSAHGTHVSHSGLIAPHLAHALRTGSGRRVTPALEVAHPYALSPFRNCTYYEPKFRALLTEDGVSRFELAEAYRRAGAYAYGVLEGSLCALKVTRSVEIFGHLANRTWPNGGCACPLSPRCFKCLAKQEGADSLYPPYP